MSSKALGHLIVCKLSLHRLEVYGIQIPPACPILLPGGAVSPAINATTGFSVPLSCKTKAWQENSVSP